MDWRAACTAVIPCFNEEAAIGSVVESVRKHVASVMVIDDGSGDGTSTRADSAGALVLSHPATRGKGAALHTGWTQAHARGFRWALIMDGDGQHSPEDIPVFFRCAARTGASLVVGNRLGEASRMPFLRRLVNRWMSADISRLAGRDLPDSQCGFRLMNLEDWARLPIVSNHFEIESEMLYQFARAGLSIEFVPIQVIYKKEQSKIHPWRDTIRWLRWRRGTRRNLCATP